jgi:hypothetical protein
LISQSRGLGDVYKRQGLNLTDQMQKECTRRQLQDAMAHVIENAAINRKGIPAKLMAVNLGL